MGALTLKEPMGKRIIANAWLVCSQAFMLALTAMVMILTRHAAQRSGIGGVEGDCGNDDSVDVDDRRGNGCYDVDKCGDDADDVCDEE